MGFNGYHHIGLSVQDSEKSLEFYKKLGGKVTHSFTMGSSSQKIYLVDLGGHAVIEIIPNGKGGDEANARFIHIALETGDAKAAYDQAIGIGAVSRTEPNDVKLGTMSACIAFVYGPDNEVIEFFQVKGFD